MVTYMSKVRITKGFYAGHTGKVKFRQAAIRSWLGDQEAMYHIELDVDGKTAYVEAAWVELSELGG